MTIFKFLIRGLTWWHSQTLNTQLFTWLKGVSVGNDEMGNQFYTSKDGLRRWVIFNGEMEASRVSPEWHGWLHHTRNDIPKIEPLKVNIWQKPHQENLTGTDMSYAPTGSMRRNNPKVRSDYEAWTPN